MMPRILAIGLPLILLSLCGLADDALPRFEAASIKRNPNSLARPFNLSLPGGRVHYTANSLSDLLSLAWRIDPDLVIGGPSWVRTTRYDVTAKPEDETAKGVSTAQIFQNISLMVRSLVIERFHAAVHLETRELPVFALAFAHKDGRLGPAVKEPDPKACQPPDLAAAPAALAEGKLPPLACGMGFVLFDGRLRGAGVDFAQLAQFLSRAAGRKVIDKTGITRKFDVDAAWKHGSDDPSLFTALQDELGVKLESQRAAVEVLVIDHAEEPSDN